MQIPATDATICAAPAKRVLQLFDQAPGFLVLLRGPDHVFEFINSSAAALMGHREVLGKSFREALPDLDGQGYYETLDRVYASGIPFIGKGDMLMFTRPDGELVERVIDFIYQPLKNDSGEVTGILCQGQDVTERKLAERERDHAELGRTRALAASQDSEARFREMAENIEDVFYNRDAKTARLIYVSPACETIWGHSAEALSRDPLAHFNNIYPKDRIALDLALRKLFLGENMDISYRLKHPTGRTVWIRERAYPVRNKAGEIVRIVGIARDVTERERARIDLKLKQRKLSHLARHDVLTGLPNRAYLKERLKTLLAAAPEQIYALLYVDIDHFKMINDSRGHAVGDELLKVIAERLTGAVSRSDLVVRMGGDEFVVLVTNLRERANAELIAERILKALAAPVRIADEVFHVTASIGIAVAPGDGAELSTLLQHADIALYEAKEQGRAGFRPFVPEMTERLVKQASLEQALREAIGTESLYLEYQPIMDARSGKSVALEALLRWQHPERGLIGPAEFIPVAEECGLICELGAHVLSSALRQLAAWREAGIPLVPVCVNISARQIAKGGFKDAITGLLQKFSLDPSLLILEITESVFMDHSAKHVAMLRELHSLGVGIAIDDFGTGYSSLSYLKHLPIDTLKIDRSFVRDMNDDQHDSAIVETIVKLAQSLGLKTIAEGVETPDQLARLTALGCDFIQGYLFGHPLSVRECEEHLLTTGGACCVNPGSSTADLNVDLSSGSGISHATACA